MMSWNEIVVERTGKRPSDLPVLSPEAMLEGQILAADPLTGDRLVTVGEPVVEDDGTEIYSDFGIVRG